MTVIYKGKCRECGGDWIFDLMKQAKKPFNIKGYCWIQTNNRQGYENPIYIIDRFIYNNLGFYLDCVTERKGGFSKGFLVNSYEHGLLEILGGKFGEGINDTLGANYPLQNISLGFEMNDKYILYLQKKGCKIQSIDLELKLGGNNLIKEGKMVAVIVTFKISDELNANILK